MSALRAAALPALVVGVLLAHLWIVNDVLPPRLGEGEGEGAAPAARRRIKVAFVRELAPAAPPAAPAVRERPRAPPRVLTSKALAASAAASAPERVEPLQMREPQPVALSQVPVLDAMPPLPAIAALAPRASVPPADPASAPASSFEWPPSTRLSYTLGGHWRGPLVGRAQVEWLRAGGRYQVHLDVSAGLVVTRRSSSEGEITSDGLRPLRFDEVTKVPFSAERRVTLLMGPDSVRFADGREAPREPGLQDSVSQFVQLTWLSITQPQWLAPGGSVELPVALARRTERIVYEVVGNETLATPAGAVDAVHIRPRAPLRQSGDLTVEFWVAPSLQYLPVKVLIRQDAETYVELLVERLPQQAVPGR